MVSTRRAAAARRREQGPRAGGGGSPGGADADPGPGAAEVSGAGSGRAVQPAFGARGRCAAAEPGRAVVRSAAAGCESGAAARRHWPFSAGT